MAKWSPERLEEYKRHRREGLRNKEVAAKMGLTPSTAAGLAYRLRKGLHIGEPVDPPHRAAYARRNIEAALKWEPARYPFAPDDTCPDFAWDDAHCTAVMAARGGFPVLPARRL